MSDYNWCHNPSCHTIETQSRVRGTGDNKVLRTMKIKVGRYNWNNDNTPNIYDYFCNHRCLMDFVAQHTQAIINLAPRREPLETPIKVEKEKYQSQRYQYDSNGGGYVPYQSTRTTIKTKNNS